MNLLSYFFAFVIERPNIKSIFYQGLVCNRTDIRFCKWLYHNRSTSTALARPSLTGGSKNIIKIIEFRYCL